MWLYRRFTVSFRHVEDRVAERGVVEAYEAIRQWCKKFGSSYAAEKEIMPSVAHRRDRRRNNRAEASYQHT